jgi:hypothetical protein
MPVIASKYKRNTRTTVFETQAPRDDAGLIKRSEGGNFYYGGNEQYIRPQVKGSVVMRTMSDRAPLKGKPSLSQGPTLYTQTEFKQQGISPWSLKQGRDNRMYTISEGYNLKKQLPQNQFDQLSRIASMISQTPTSKHPAASTLSLCDQIIKRVDKNSSAAFLLQRSSELR